MLSRYERSGGTRTGAYGAASPQSRAPKKHRFRAIFATLVAAACVAGGSFAYAANSGAFAAAGDDASQPAGPATSKTLTSNGDGTYTLSLSVTGQASASSEASRANVVVIMDRSGSMDEPSGTHSERLTKLDVEKQAANLLADTLRPYNTAEHSDAIQLALIDFGGSATLAQSPTSDIDAYEAAVNRVESNNSPSYDAGTNWEAALQLAKSTADGMASGDRSDVPTYVVFVSDGLPTYRQSPVYTEAELHNNSRRYYNTSNYRTQNDRGWWNYTEGGSQYYYTSAAPYGQGNGDSYGNNYNSALDEAQSIVGSNYTLFTIAAYGDSSTNSRMADLATQSGTGIDHNYNATDSESLNEAFSDISMLITHSLGFTDVKLADVLTAMTSASIRGGIDTGNVTYTKTTAEGATSAWTDAPAITVSGDNVNWDLSSIGSLENGVTYTASFKVWPSQDAYDLVAQLYNANDPAAAYEALTDDQKSQIAMITDAQGNVSFGLRTNTDDTAVSYTQTYTETMGTLPEGRTIGVTYRDTIDGITYDVVYSQNSDGTYTMTRTADGTSSIDNPDPVPLTVSSMSVTKAWNDNGDLNRPGFVVLHVLQDGAQFESVTLSADNNWTASVHIAPGLIANGETLETGHEYTVTEDLGENPEALSHYELVQIPSHPMIVDGTLQASATDASAAALRATNDLKGSIRIGKVVSADNGLTPSADAEFTYTVSLKDAKGNALTDVPYTHQTSATSSETGTISDDGTFTLKATEYLTISDLPVGATYSVTETQMPAAYTFTQVEGSSGVTTDNDKHQASGTVAAASTATISFQNAYHATPTTASIPVAKHLDYTDAASNVPNIQNAFTFTLAAGSASADAPLPATTSYTNPGSGNGTAGYGAHDGGTVTFGDITFTKPGRYAYAITETGTVAGVVNDASATKYVGVVVTDNGEGALIATVSGADGSTTSPEATTFTNSYQMPASVALPVSKALSTIPSTLTAPDIQGKFTFTLQPDASRYTDQSTVPMPAGSTASGGNVTYQLTNPLAAGGNMSYPAISYAEAGTYYYTITETGAVDGVTNDVAPGTSTPLGGVRYITVTVSEVDVAESDVNDLKAEIQVYASRDAQTQGTGAANAAAFVNLYTAQPATVDLTVYKDLVADSALTPPDILDKVTFTLHREAGSSLPMPGGATTDEVSITNGTQVDADTTSGTFDSISFTEPGEYLYYVTESADIAGVSVQTISHFVLVTVTDNGHGQLVAATRINEQGEQLSFTNTYEVAPVSVTLSASKTLAYADDPSPASIAGKFTYTITADEADAPLPATRTATNPGTGNGTDGYAAHDGGTVSFDAIEYVKPGTYHYHITETGSAAGVTNDADTTRDVTVTVVDNRDGTMAATVTGDLDANASTANTVSFTNTYALTQEYVAGTIPAAKVVASSDGLFTPDVTDKYTYTLAAVTSGAPMPATATLTGPANAGTASQPSVYASGTYTVPGTYQMGSFSDIRFTRPGTYSYKVTESGSVSGITNDSAATGGKTVTVTVTDNGDGTLSLTLVDAAGNAINAANPVSFTNVYQTPASTTAIIPVTKQISGDFNGDASRWFAFMLSAVEDTPMPGDGVTTISNPSAKGGTASYDAITYTRPGIYFYQVTESSDTHAGFTNDADNPKNVVVIVRDPQDGTGLVATLVGADSVIDTNNSIDPANWTITEAKDSSTFTNVYQADSVSTNIPVSKSVEVAQRGITAPDFAGAFTFTLTAGTNDAGVTTPMPADATTIGDVTTKSVTNPDSTGGWAWLGDIEFTVAGTYNYTIAESGTKAGFTNDATTHQIAVTVTDDGTGALSQTTTCDGAPLPANAAVSFTNTFTPVTATINGTKTLTGRDMLPDETFEFTSVAADQTTADAIANGTVVMGTTEQDPLATTVTGTVSGGADGVPQEVNYYDPYTFKAPGTYTFAISEVRGSAPGVTYDGTTHNVSVTVTEDAATHALIATVNQSEQAALTFNNTYTATGSVAPEGTKVLYGAEDTTPEAIPAGAFTFKIAYQNGNLAGQTAGTGTNKACAAGETAAIEFSPLSYTTAGEGSLQSLVNAGAASVEKAADGTVTYRIGYVVTEDTVTTAYQPNYQELNLVVTVVDDGSGTLGVTAAGPEAGMTFVNRTAGQEVTLDVDVLKSLTGRELKEGEFSFAVSGVDSAGSANVPLPAHTTATNDAQGTIDFGEITFTGDDLTNHLDAGSTTTATFTYTFTENVPAGATHNDDGSYTYQGVTYRDVTKTMTAQISRDQNNHLIVQVTSGSPIIEFTNTYEPGSTTAAIPVTKALAAGEGAVNLPDIAGSYTFTLSGMNTTDPMPAAGGEVVTNPDAAGGTASFGPITFTTAGTYSYRITEAGTVAGVANDGDALSGKVVTVTVTDDGSGALHATVTGADGSATDASATTFTNTYEVQPATATIPVSKALTQGESSTALPNITNAYTFTLTANDGAPMPAGTGNVVTNPDATGGTASFGQITFSKPGTYTYTITESGTVAGIVNDAAAASGKTATVVVSDNGAGQLAASVAGADSTADAASADTTFTNTYNPQPGTVQIPVTKILASDTGAATPDITDAYTFTLAAGPNTAGVTTPMPAAGGETITNPSANGGTASFGAISFSKPGTYTYTVTESGSVMGVQNDQAATRTVQVEVTDDASGTLTATVAGDAAPTFINTYYTPGELTGETAIAGTKTIEGRDMLDGEQFTFTLTSGDDATTAALANDTVVLGGDASATSLDASVTGALDGSPATFRFGNITFHEPGTYSFSVTENAGSAGGLTYDGARHAVSVSVERDTAANRLVVTANADDLKNLNFTNTYEGSTQIDPPGTKTLLGPDGTKQAISQGQFTFGLQYAQGDEKGVNATTGYTLAAEAGSDAVIEFGQIDYTIAGLHDLVSGGMATKGVDGAGRTTYTIPYNAVETNDAGEGVLPNRQVIGYTVTVTDNGDGTLDASVAIDDDAQTLAFTNYPSSVTATVDISGLKVLTGARPLQAGDFSFTISGVDEGGNAAPLPDKPTVENTASGAVNFGTITFEFDAAEEEGEQEGQAEKAAEQGGALDKAVEQSGETAESTMQDVQASKSGSETREAGVQAGSEIAQAGNPVMQSSESVEVGAQTGTQVAQAGEASAQADEAGVQNGATSEAASEGIASSKSGATAAVADAPAPESGVASDAAAEDVTLSSAVDLGSNKLPRGATKTYTYTITESGAIPGVTNDTPKTFTVKVTRGEDGFLTVETNPGQAPLFTFNNTYEPIPGSSSVTSQIGVDKVLHGRDLATGEFTFTLTPTQVPEGATRPETVSGTNAADGTVTLPAVTFDKPGTYTFKLVENAGDAAHITYDTVTYNVTARVTDVFDGNPMRVEWVFGAGRSIVFENTYTPPAGSLTVSKAVKGTGSTRSDFGFTVTLSDTTINGTYGAATFENGVARLTLTDGQALVITGLPEGVTYKVVEDDYSGAYTVQASGDTGTIADGQAAVASFTNTVVPPATPSTPSTPTRSSTPDTGDHTLPPLVPALIAAAGVALVVISRKRHA